MKGEKSGVQVTSTIVTEVRPIPGIETMDANSKTIADKTVQPPVRFWCIGGLNPWLFLAYPSGEDVPKSCRKLEPGD